jgi:hypothetical protein
MVEQLRLYTAWRRKMLAGPQAETYIACVNQEGSAVYLKKGQYRRLASNSAIRHRIVEGQFLTDGDFYDSPLEKLFRSKGGRLDPEIFDD